MIPEIESLAETSKEEHRASLTTLLAVARTCAATLHSGVHFVGG